MKRYVLDGRKIVHEPDLLSWAKWFGNVENRIVAKTDVAGYEVSTVFLGLDHNFLGGGPPVLWETMVFGVPSRSDLDMDRCSGGFEQAEEMHRRMVDRVCEALGQQPRIENEEAADDSSG